MIDESVSSVYEISFYPEIINFLSSMPNVKAFVPQISSYSVLEAYGKKSAAAVFGVDIEDYLPLMESIKIIEGESFKNNEKGILVSQAWADNFKKENKKEIKIGTEVQLVYSDGNTFRIRALPVKGIYSYPLRNEILDKIVLADSETVRSLLGMDSTFAEDVIVDEDSTNLIDSMDFNFDDMDSLFAEESDVFVEESESTAVPNDIFTDSNNYISNKVTNWHFVVIRLFDKNDANLVIKKINLNTDINPKTLEKTIEMLHKKLKENPNIDRLVSNFNAKVNNKDVLIFIGDLYDARRIYDKKEMPKLDHIKKLNGHKIFVKGNHDVDPDQAYYDLGFDLVCTRHEIGNLVFTHEPVAVNENQINIHGHLHYCRDYWYVKPTSHIDVYTARFNYQPINVKEAVLKYNDGVMKPLAVNTFNELFGMSVVNESNDIESINNSIVKIKVLCNPESRGIFTLNDKSSQIMINEHYVIQRDIKGTNCSITQGQCDETNRKVLEFDVVFNENLNIDVLIKEKIESGIQISSLFNPDDMENRFIREMSMKLFGLYPDRCELYR